MLRWIRQRFCRHQYDSLERLPSFRVVDGHLLTTYRGVCRKCGAVKCGTMEKLKWEPSWMRR